MLVGCGYLEPTEVDQDYVRNKFEKDLKRFLGGEFIVQIQEFDEQSELREATAIVYPNNDPSLSFEITGSIKEDCLDASCYGSSYHTEGAWKFEDILYAKIRNDLAVKYDLEIHDNVDYNLISKNILLYLNDFKSLLSPYKDGTYFDIYFDERFIRGYVPITFNGEIKMVYLVIDSNNDKVVIDYSQGEYGWVGELEIVDYLKYWVDGRLNLVICEIKCNHYPSVVCTCEEEY